MLPRIEHEESVSRKLGFLLLFFLSSKASYRTQSVHLFPLILLFLIFSLKMGKLLVAGPLIVLFYFHNIKVQRRWSGGTSLLL